MSHDSISKWVQKAKDATETASADEGVKVVRREAPKSKGNIIMDIADKIWPSLMYIFEGVRDEGGMLLQPAHVRGIALNVAQLIVKKREDKKSDQ